MRLRKDSFEFCDNIEKITAENDVSNHFMRSFDITSLFTSIPLEETLNVCLDALYRDPDICKRPQPEKLLRKMLLKATTEVEFSFKDTTYRQIDILNGVSPSPRQEQLHWKLWPNDRNGKEFTVVAERNKHVN